MIAAVRISLVAIPGAGSSQMIVRLTSLDMSVVQRAAAILRMSQADFLRTALINTAGAVIKQSERKDDVEAMQHYEKIISGPEEDDDDVDDVEDTG